MPLTGVLRGDFSSFIDAVGKAETALKDFQGDADKVQVSLNRMGDAFSGKKVIQDAELATKAIKDLGGATTLTQNEQTKLNAMLTEAIAKYTALGQKAPPEMVALANATKQVETATAGAKTATTDMLGSLGKMASAVGIGFSIGAVVSFGKSVLDSASQIGDLASQLGISTDAVQGFKFAAEQSGSSLDAVGTALTKMNSNLAGGSDSTVAALKRAGLAFDDIRSMAPEDAFLAITDAIQKIPDPMVQTRVALELFGKSAAELLPAIKEGFRGVSDGASKMSQDTITSLKEAQDSWSALGTKVTIVTGKMIADAMKFLNVWQRMKDDIDRGTPKAPNAPPGPQTGATDLGISAEDVDRASRELDGVRAKLDAVATAHANLIRQTQNQIFGTNAITAAKTYTESLGTIANLSKVSSVEQEKINKSIGEALDVYTRFGKVAPQAMRDLYIATAKIPDAIAGIPSSVGKIGEQFDIVIPKMTDASTLLTYISGIPFGVKVGQQVDLVPPKVKQLQADFGELADALGHLAQVSGGTFGRITGDLANLSAGVKNAQRGMSELGQGVGALASGDVLDGIVGITTGVTDLVSAAIQAGKAIAHLFGFLDRNKGRDVVVDFAETFGGFDALHVKLLELGADGEALWIKLTQGVGRNNPAQAQQAIDDVTQALDEQAAKSDDAKSATEDQAQATIETATEAAKALEELGGKLTMNVDEWKKWGGAVTGVLQEIGNTVRSLPMPSPAGALPFSAGSGGSSGNGSTAVLAPIVIQAGNEVLARQVVKTFVRNGL